MKNGEGLGTLTCVTCMTLGGRGVGGGGGGGRGMVPGYKYMLNKTVSFLPVK